MKKHPEQRQKLFPLADGWSIIGHSFEGVTFDKKAQMELRGKGEMAFPSCGEIPENLEGVRKKRGA